MKEQGTPIMILAGTASDRYSNIVMPLGIIEVLGVSVPEIVNAPFLPAHVMIS